MKHMGKRIVLSIAVPMLAALPVLADDTAGCNCATGQKTANPEQKSGKVECMLAAENDCLRGRKAVIQIDMLTKEINKGTAVYTKGELIILNNELDRARRDLFDEYGGGF